jgi:hypothetical protein
VTSYNDEHENEYDLRAKLASKPLSEAGTSAAELAVEILTTLADHYEAQSIDTLSVAEKIRLDNAATHVRNVAAALIQPTPAETEGGEPTAWPGDDLHQIIGVLETIEYVAHNDIKAAGMKSIWDFARYAQGIAPRIRAALTASEAQVSTLSRHLEEAREALKAENEACAAVCQVWLDQFAARGRHLQHTSPEQWANDAIEDIMDAIRGRAKETVSHG